MTYMHFYPIMKDLELLGQRVVSRGLETKEIIGYNYCLPPRVRFMTFDARKLKMDYIKQEFLWYLVGEPTDHSICKVAKMWEGLINPDQSINSNYGYHIFNPVGGSNNICNFNRVVKTLTTDPQSRRAVMMILNTNHLNSDTKDYPCTVYMNFLIRDGKLHLFVRMRSQDAIFGMGNDAPFFSFVHELMFQNLKAYSQFDALQMGNYHHSADSFHVYEKHYNMLQSILENPVGSPEHHYNCPPMTFKTPARVFQLRQELLKPEPNFDQLIDDSFIAWLLTREDPETLCLPKIV